MKRKDTVYLKRALKLQGAEIKKMTKEIKELKEAKEIEIKSYPLKEAIKLPFQVIWYKIKKFKK
jgi:hypothetical protein